MQLQKLKSSTQFYLISSVGPVGKTPRMYKRKVKASSNIELISQHMRTKLGNAQIRVHHLGRDFYRFSEIQSCSHPNIRGNFGQSLCRVRVKE